MNTASVFIQKIFFRDLKVSPKEIWQHRAEALGCFSQSHLLRRDKKISFYTIDPNPTEGSRCLSDYIVIFSHPISRKGKYFFSDSPRAQMYLNHGCTVLAFDYNGFGQSDRIDLYYWQDAARVIDYVKSEYPHKKIIVHGASFGAFHIIRALSFLPEQSLVVLENVNKSLLDYWKKWPLTATLVRVLQTLRLRAIRDMDVQAVFRQFARDDLFIQFFACEKDEMTTLSEMRELYEILASENKSFTVFPGVGHLAAPTKNPALYQSALLTRGCQPC